MNPLFYKQVQPILVPVKTILRHPYKYMTPPHRLGTSIALICSLSASLLQGSGKQLHQSSQQNVHIVPLTFQLCFHNLGELLGNE
uniref:Uncharacterized protein n=1 Tax=Arundo donax TaxID=35708 RepID=A0A0A9CH86_ARUDO